MRAQTPSAPTALTAYTPTPHGPYFHSLLYIETRTVPTASTHCCT